MGKIAKIFLIVIGLNALLFVLYLSVSSQVLGNFIHKVNNNLHSTYIESNFKATTPSDSSNGDNAIDPNDLDADSNNIDDIPANKTSSGLDLGDFFSKVTKQVRKIAKQVSKVQKKTFHSIGLDKMFKDVDLPDDDIDTDTWDDSVVDQIHRLAENRLTTKYLDLAGKFVYKLNEFRYNLRESNIFENLGAYQQLDVKYFNAYPNGHPLYSYPNMGLINDPSYCEIVDYYNLFNPENVFDSMNFFTDYHPEGNSTRPRRN